MIPAFNAADVIGTQLAGLHEQVNAPLFEVVVADNGSTDGLANVIGAWQSRLPGLRLVDASRGRGVSVARNEGIKHAGSDLILVCDADDRVSPAWVAAMLTGLKTHSLVSGPVETTLLSGESAGWVPIEHRTSGLFETWEGRTYGIGCDLRTPPRSLGGSWRLRRGLSGWGGEIDFAWRAGDIGYEFTYIEGALLHYRIRTDLRGVLRQQYNSGRGVATLYDKFRPQEVVAKSTSRRVRHELRLIQQFPWRGDANDRRMWLTRMAFEAGKLLQARRRGVSAP